MIAGDKGPLYANRQRGFLHKHINKDQRWTHAIRYIPKSQMVGVEYVVHYSKCLGVSVSRRIVHSVCLPLIRWWCSNPPLSTTVEVLWGRVLLSLKLRNLHGTNVGCTWKLLLAVGHTERADNCPLARNPKQLTTERTAVCSFCVLATLLGTMATLVCTMAAQFLTKSTPFCYIGGSSAHTVVYNAVTGLYTSHKANTILYRLLFPTTGSPRVGVHGSSGRVLRGQRFRGRCRYHVGYSLGPAQGVGTSGYRGKVRVRTTQGLAWEWEQKGTSSEPR